MSRPEQAVRMEMGVYWYIVKENDGALKAVKKLYIHCAQHVTQHYIIGAALSRSYSRSEPNTKKPKKPPQH
jgi:hypothetical protein